MSQQQILKILWREKEGMTTKELSEKIGVSQNTINVAINRLYKYGEVKFANKKLKGKPIKVWSLV